MNWIFLAVDFARNYCFFHGIWRLSWLSTRNLVSLYIHIPVSIASWKLIFLSECKQFMQKFFMFQCGNKNDKTFTWSHFLFILFWYRNFKFLLEDTRSTHIFFQIYDEAKTRRIEQNKKISNWYESQSFGNNLITI